MRLLIFLGGGGLVVVMVDGCGIVCCEEGLLMEDILRLDDSGFYIHMSFCTLTIKCWMRLTIKCWMRVKL